MASEIALQPERQKRQRISVPVALLMVALALIFDGLQDLALFVNVIPAVGTVIDFIFSEMIAWLAAIIFFVWFAVLGVNYGGKKAALKLLISLSSFIVELIPLIDALPAITVGVVSLIIITRAEDSVVSGRSIGLVLGGVGQVGGAVGLTAAKSATKAGAELVANKERSSSFLDLRPLGRNDTPIE